MRRSRASIVPRIAGLSLCICLAVFWPLFVAAETARHGQAAAADDSIIVYAEDLENAQDPSIQVGNTAKLGAAVETIAGAGRLGIDTVIMIDNSLSITEENRERFKEIIRELVDHHAEGERYTLACFDKEIHFLSKKSASYEELKTQIDKLSFEYQDTYLKDSVYSVLTDAGLFERDHYKRIILFSDGADDNEVGYTYDEIKSLLRETGVHLYTVGCIDEGNVSGLEKMFSLSRACGTDYYQLDTIESNGEVSGAITGQTPKAAITAGLPGGLADGSIQTIRVSYQLDGTEHSFETRLKMPMEDLGGNAGPNAGNEGPDAGNAGSDAGNAGPDAGNAVTGQEGAAGDYVVDGLAGSHGEGKVTVGKRIPVFIGLIGVIALAAVIAFVLGRRRNGKGTADGSGSADGSALDRKDDNKKRQEFKELRYVADDSETLLSVDEGNTVAIATTAQNEESGREAIIKLTDLRDSENVYTSKAKKTIVVGRSSECDITIKGDKSISGKHFILSVKGDSVSITDNNSLNGTKLNGQRLTDTIALIDGDIIEIGRGKYRYSKE